MRLHHRSCNSGLLQHRPILSSHSNVYSYSAVYSTTWAAFSSVLLCASQVFALVSVTRSWRLRVREPSKKDRMNNVSPGGRRNREIESSAPIPSEEKIAASYFWVRVRSVQEPCSSHASANLAKVSSQRLPPSHLAFRGAIQLGWPRMNPDVGRQPAAGIKIARKIKLTRDQRVRLLLWSAVYYQYSLGLRCLPWHHLRSRQH